MVLLSAQGMPVARIAEVSFTSDDRVRDVIHNFNTDGFHSLYPKYKGGRPKIFTLPERCEIKKIAKCPRTVLSAPPSTEKCAPVSEGRSCSDQGGDAERVACGIQQDPPPVGVRLEFGLDGSQSEQASLSGVQVVDA